jgi:hypothetical protein
VRSYKIENTDNNRVTIDTLVYDVFTLSLNDPIFIETTELYLRNEADGLWELGVKCSNTTELQRSMYFMFPASMDVMGFIVKRRLSSYSFQ